MPLNEDEIKKVLAQNIKSARISAKFTQETLAELTNVSLNFIKDVENARSGVSITTMINICIALKITPNELFKSFFKDAFDSSENLTQQINLLNNYQKDAVSTLVKYFNTNDMY